MSYRIETLDESWDERWDHFAGWEVASGFMQSSIWAKFKRLEGAGSTRLGLFENGELSGGGTLFWSEGTQHPGYVLCPEGPVLPWEDHAKSREGLRSLLSAVEAIEPKSQILGLRIEPHIPPPRPSIIRNWVRAPVDLTPVDSLFLDLRLTNEELLAGMHPKGRYNLKLAQKHGVQVRVSNDLADLRTFYELFDTTAQRGEFFAEPYSFFLNLGATHFPENHASLLIAEWEGAPLASILTVAFGRRTTYLYGGSTRTHREKMPNYLLHWTAVQIARERGCLEYDLYGYDPFDHPNHPYAGFTRFKTQLGGYRFSSIGAHDHLFYDRLADCLAERLK